MTALLIILLLLALIFGIGAVLEGIFWLLLIAIAAIVVLAVFGWFKFRSVGRSRTSSGV
jgi:hypothetical protein